MLEFSNIIHPESFVRGGPTLSFLVFLVDGMR